MTRRTSKQILAHATDVITAVVTHVRNAKQQFPMLDKFTDLMAAGETKAPGHLVASIPTHPADRREFLSLVQDVGIYNVWAKSKVVYAMDDILLGYLRESTSSKIPTAVLRNIRNPNPFILLPEPDFTDEETLSYRETIGIPLGAFVFGRWDDGRRLCSTMDERSTSLGVMFVGVIATPQGPATQFLRCSIPLGESEITVEEAVKATVDGFVFGPDLAEAEAERLTVWLTRYVSLIFHSLLYVCTKQPDIETYRPTVSPKGKAKKARRARPDQIEEVVKLGFRLGPELFAAEQAAERAYRSASTEGGGGWEHRPHRRPGHHRIYYVGPGRRTAELRWVRPHWVRLDLLSEASDGPDDVVVRPVR
ncbi:hypothetical protein ACFWAP_00920 [Streptomyces goshikiensis]|uniref:hypothetical protein n=1 Tax=Streptomyces goshikiensis TaxID=1942 RepID=UPI00366505F3